MLLSDDEFGELDAIAKDFYKHVRWDFSSEQARLAKWTADKILENVSETMEQHSALSHVEYINREKAFERMTRKNFSKPPISTKVKAIAATWR